MVYAWALKRLGTQEAIDDFNTGLVELLPWQDASSESGAASEAESFMAMMNNQR